MCAFTIPRHQHQHQRLVTLWCVFLQNDYCMARIGYNTFALITELGGGLVISAREMTSARPLGGAMTSDWPLPSLDPLFGLSWKCNCRHGNKHSEELPSHMHVEGKVAEIRKIRLFIT